MRNNKDTALKNCTAQASFRDQHEQPINIQGKEVVYNYIVNPIKIAEEKANRTAFNFALKQNNQQRKFERSSSNKRLSESIDIIGKLITTTSNMNASNDTRRPFNSSMKFRQKVIVPK